MAKMSDRSLTRSTRPAFNFLGRKDFFQLFANGSFPKWEADTSQVPKRWKDAIRASVTCKMQRNQCGMHTPKDRRIFLWCLDGEGCFEHEICWKLKNHHWSHGEVNLSHCTGICWDVIQPGPSLTSYLCWANLKWCILKCFWSHPSRKQLLFFMFFLEQCTCPWKIKTKNIVSIASLFLENVPTKDHWKACIQVNLHLCQKEP